MSGAGSKKKRRTSGVIATSSVPRRSTCTLCVAQHAEPAALHRRQARPIRHRRRARTRATPRNVKLSSPSHSQEGSRLRPADRAGTLPGARSSCRVRRLEALQHRPPVGDDEAHLLPDGGERVGEIARLRLGQRPACGRRCSFPGARRSVVVADAGRCPAGGRPCRARVSKIGCKSRRTPMPRACSSPSTESTRNGMSSLTISISAPSERLPLAPPPCGGRAPCGAPSAWRR